MTALQRVRAALSAGERSADADVREVCDHAGTLVDLLDEARRHLEYCGYGDAWERECAEHAELPSRLADAIAELSPPDTSDQLADAQKCSKCGRAFGTAASAKQHYRAKHCRAAAIREPK